MTKFKIQREKRVVLALKHFDFNCHLDFGIWNLANGIATHFSPVVARHDSAEAIPACPPCHCAPRLVGARQSRRGERAYHALSACHCEESSAEAISVCPPVVARHDSAEAIPAG